MSVKAIAVNRSSEMWGSKVKDYLLLVKFRLTFTVVFSSAIGYLLASGSAGFELLPFIILILGSFLIVGAANAINQIIERNYDKLMTRTSNRPLAQNRMSVGEAVIFSTLAGLTGVVLMGVFLNQITALLAFSGLFIYSFVYTPLKRISPIAVFVGAIAGSIPPLAGFAAVNGNITELSIVLFIIQFFWQFPHFWAIAWKMNDDYQRAGFKLLPLGANKDKIGALQILMFTIVLLPLSILPAKLGLISIWASLATLLASGYLTWLAVKLFRDLSDQSALKLMFGSFIYLPLVFIFFVLDKFIF